MLDDHLPLRMDSALEYIYYHDSQFFQFLRERVREADQERATDELLKEPVVVANMLKNYSMMSEHERFIHVMGLVATPGNVTVMIGAKRYGKTSSAFVAIEYFLAAGVTVYWYGFSLEIKKQYPQVIQTFDMKKVKDGVLFVDETAVQADAMDFAQKEQKDRMKQIWTAGHSDYSIVYLSQTFRINIKILNAMDIIWFKPFFQMDFDREKAKDKFSETYEYLKPVHKNENLVIDHQTNNSWFFTNDLPEKWNDRLSKAFARIENRKDAIDLLGKLMEASLSEREQKVMLEQRGWNRDDLVQNIMENYKAGDDNLTIARKEELPDNGLYIARKDKLLRKAGLKDALRCDVCGSSRIFNKGMRASTGRMRKYCADCGRTGYQERFNINWKEASPVP